MAINLEKNTFAIGTSEGIGTEMPKNKYWIIDWGYCWKEISKKKYLELKENIIKSKILFDKEYGNARIRDGENYEKQNT